MPTQFSALDSGFPTFTGNESVEEKVDALHNFTYMLLEYLRYILRNLGPDNLNTAEMVDWMLTGGADAQEITRIVNNITYGGGDTIIYQGVVPQIMPEALTDEDVEDAVVNVIHAQTVVTDELYADYGAIADLTVDELRTDYMRAARYLAGNTSNLDYIYIHDEEIDFITATVKSGTPTPTEQLHHGDRYFYWTDETHTEMTGTKVTEWPVTVYRYDEGTKGRFYFTEEEDSQGHTYKVPVLKLGQGSDAGGVNSTGRLIKHPDGLELSYTTEQGETIGIWQLVSGYMDLYGLRKPTELDFSDWDAGYVGETLDGGVVNSWTVEFEDDDPTKPPVKFTDSGGHETAVVWS